MQRYSVFLTPGGADFAYTDNLIRELSGMYGAPLFEPHVTVYSGTLTDVDALKKAISTAVSGIRPFALRVRRVGCGESYFKSLFIEFEENLILREIHDRIRAGMEIESGYELIPHLSLLYSDMPLLHKEALAKRVIVDRQEIHFDGMKIVIPLNREEGWRDTGQWQTLLRVGLEEACPGA